MERRLRSLGRPLAPEGIDELVAADDLVGAQQQQQQQQRERLVSGRTWDRVNPQELDGKTLLTAYQSRTYAERMSEHPYQTGEKLWLHGGPVIFSYEHPGGGAAVVRPLEGGHAKVVPLAWLSRERPVPGDELITATTRTP